MDEILRAMEKINLNEGIRFDKGRKFQNILGTKPYQILTEACVFCNSSDQVALSHVNIVDDTRAIVPAYLAPECYNCRNRFTDLHLQRDCVLYLEKVPVIYKSKKFYVAE